MEKGKSSVSMTVPLQKSKSRLLLEESQKNKFNEVFEVCKIGKVKVWTIVACGNTSPVDVGSVLNWEHIWEIYYYKITESKTNNLILIGKAKDFYFNFKMTYKISDFSKSGNGYLYYADNWDTFWIECLEKQDRRNVRAQLKPFVKIFNFVYII